MMLQLLSNVYKRFVQAILRVILLALFGSLYIGVFSEEVFATEAKASVNFDSDGIHPDKGATDHTETLVLIYHDPSLEGKDQKVPSDKKLLEAHENFATKPPIIQLLGSAHGLESLTFGNPSYKTSIGFKHYWWVEVNIKGLRNEQDLEIALWISFSESAVFTTSLVVKAYVKKEALEWTLIPPVKDLVITSANSHSASIMATTGAYPAIGMDLKMATLQDEVTKKILPMNNLDLCDPNGNTCDPFNIEARTDKNLTLKVKNFNHLGTYTGNVTIGPVNATSSKQIKLTVYSSSDYAKLVGGGFIIIGLLITFFVKVFSRNYIARKEARLKAALVRSHLADLLKRANEIALRRGVELPNVASVVKDFELELAELENNIPHWASHLGRDDTAWKAKFKTELEATNLKILIIDILVQEGIRTLDVIWITAKEKRMKTEMENMDALLSLLENKVDKASMEAAITKVLVRVHALKPGSFNARAFKVQGKTEIETLSLQIGIVNSSLWIIWFVVAAITGAYTLIYSNLGFGITDDFFKCLLWGLGFGFTGNTLSALTSDSAQKTLGIAFPKVVT